ncbi:MAG: histidine kinase, partial [Mariniphaga sp.]|nr:histidine kinase [Mariniphaga sp.]
GMPEILAWNYAPSNVPYETEFTDTRAWIGAFDLEMNYLFPPIPMPEGYGYVYTSPTTFSDSLFFAIYSNRSSDTIPNRIFLLDYHGNILNEKPVFQDDPTLYSQKLGIIDNKNYLLINNIGQFELTAELDNLPQQKMQRQKNYNPYFHLKSWPVDVNGNGTEELVYYHVNTSEIEIVNEKYKQLAGFRLPFDRLRITNIYPYLVNGKTDRLMVVTDSGYFFMQYTENPFYWAKYLVWLAIFFTAWGFTWLVQFFQRRRMEQKWKTEKQLTELQFNTIRNQLNPHFIFNALSSVGYLIENGKKEEAYDYLSINSRLIRKVLEDAEITTRPLEEELHFVRDYLSVQEFRFGGKFVTQINIGENVDLKLAVPKMVLHTYVENAVKHAFNEMESGGRLEIGIHSFSKGVELVVRDNGKWKTPSKNSSESTGKGIKIMESYYRIFEKQHQCKIQTVFTDLQKTNPSLSGTEVSIRMEY